MHDNRNEKEKLNEEKSLFFEFPRYFDRNYYYATIITWLRDHCYATISANDPSVNKQ